MKQLWILAGANGSGKSTFYREYIEPKGIKFVNADLIAKSKDNSETTEVVKESQIEAHELFHANIRNSESFCYETVFSHESKLEFLKTAQKAGYKIILIYIHLDNPELNLARVAQRVSEGGHPVPENKITERISRTMKHIEEAFLIADESNIYDNTFQRYELQATIRNGTLSMKVGNPPAWLNQILSRVVQNQSSHRVGSITLNATLKDIREASSKIQLCPKCNRFLRGERRRAHGICSICDPKLKR